MEPPFNWTATMLQMPGILVAQWLGPYGDYAPWYQWGITLAVQAALYTSIGFALLTWHDRKKR